MFKKLKDKLAEEVKSSPQRIQQFAQAAQAAVTSASSSISDITNNDLFSIGDSDGQQPSHSKLKGKPNNEQTTLLDVPLDQSSSAQSSGELLDHSIGHESMVDNQRQRRLSNSSFASDVSFRLPSYESPSMYHLQSDMDVSASEAESFSNSAVSLDRVTKEQLYAAYRRTQERYSKYRTQYADLARHYKLLERENAKARSVLVETQDKALRRISELREQCSLEQSAKAHLEKALRVEIDERNMKIKALETKIKLLVENKQIDENTNDDRKPEDDTNTNLISLDSEKEVNKDNSSEIQVLNAKIEKLEQLLNKYKESLKATKEKNSQMTTELQIINVELEQRKKFTEEKKLIDTELAEAKNEIQKLNEFNEELQNKIKTHEFTEIKENFTLKADLEKAKEEIEELRAKIHVFTKREEENAISLAENKLSIHKELESKEAEIKSLKNSLSASKQEVQSLNIVITDYKNNIASLEEERSKLRNNINELNTVKTKLPALETQLQEFTRKSQSLEQFKIKADEEYKCLQLQLNQETAEKLAMKDRNVYLENRNQQLSEENSKKSFQIQKFEIELQAKVNENALEKEKAIFFEEINTWKSKYEAKETEIREEREELGKLQSEIEKLLANYELIREHNSQLNDALGQLKQKNIDLTQEIISKENINKSFNNIFSDIKDIKEKFHLTRSEFLKLKDMNYNYFKELSQPLAILSSVSINDTVKDDLKVKYKELQQQNKLIQEELNNAINKSVSKSNEIMKLKNEIEQLNTKISATANESQNIELKFNNMQSEHDIAMQNIKSSKKENENIVQEIKKYKNEASALHEEIHNLNAKLLKANTDKEEIKAKLKIVESDHKNALDNIIASSKKENEELLKEVEDYKRKFDELQSQYIESNNELSSAVTEIDYLKEENKTINSKIAEAEKNNLLLQSETNEFRKLGENYMLKLELLTNEKQDMEKTLQEFLNLQKALNKLEEDNKLLCDENVSLRKRYDHVTKSFEGLEAEINELRKSHLELEKEKDHLNSVISTLENDVNNKIESEVETKSVQTDDLENYSKPEELQVLNNEFVLLKDKCKDFEKEILLLKEINDQLSNKISEQILHNNDELAKEFDLAGRYDTLIKENDTLKEENKRFKSDIEGLQAYLTKISKENGHLNDKLREMIASSENFGTKTDCESSNEYKEQLDTCNYKITELSRENMLLVEENLELKDQLQSQNYAVKNTNILSSEKNNGVQKKYENALNAKKILENKLDELEQANRMINTNMQQTQQSNEKLRLTNQKLETRLDEALVSLRHLHALQENTELEYLRNILYEYLTGPGNHSVTLAKVIAAVVKFDDSQTQMILQKEKERQGFLRQLGLL